MHALKGIAILEREEREIRAEIKKLNARLDRITAIYESVERLVTGKTKAQKTQTVKRSNSTYIDPHSLHGQVLAIIRDLDKPIHVKVLAKQFYKPSEDPTPKQKNAMSNACIALINKGAVVKVRRGVFRVHEAFRKPADTKAEIGHDTRISQVSSQAH